MCFFRRKSRSFSLNDLLGFDFRKIDFVSVFPFERYAITSLAVATCQKQPVNLILLNDWQGRNDPVSSDLLENKLMELQQVIYKQNPVLMLEAGWKKDSLRANDFIQLNSKTPMSDVLDSVFQSHVQQRRPVLVGIERSDLLYEKPSRLNALLERDAFFHINFLSLLGHHGEIAKKTAFRLLHAGRVAFLGFEMNDFAILLRDEEVELDESVIKLLADQNKQIAKATIFVDEVSLDAV